MSQLNLSFLEAALKECEHLKKEIANLRAENSRLRKSLSAKNNSAVSLQVREDEQHIQVHTKTIPTQPQRSDTQVGERIALLRSLFRGRDDVFAERKEKNGKSEYYPAKWHDWDNHGKNEKGKMICAPACQLLSLTDRIIEEHLAGKRTVGIYPLLPAETCWFLAADFDKSTWMEDSQAFREICAELGVPAHLERSRSGNGAHVWIFFECPIAASLARRFGTLVITIYKQQAMRLPIFDTPRIISCASDFPKHIALPLGCSDELVALLFSNGVEVKLADERFAGNQINVSFTGELRPKQQEAVSALLETETGILSATTGFGKTVVAANVIASRQVNTLILVHRTQLLEQWKKRLSTFLNMPIKSIGQIGDGKNKPTGVIDVAMFQSMTQKGEVNDIVATYGQVIIDECHHVSAFTFEKVMSQAKSKYVLGLTATPARKDSHHPIFIMQCGPIRFRYGAKEQAASQNLQCTVIPRQTPFKMPAPSTETPIHEIFERLPLDSSRNELIVNDILTMLEAKRSPLVITERIDHLEELARRLSGFAKNIVMLRGGMSKKARREIDEQLASIPFDQERLLLATGKYIGEGFDDMRLDTLFLAWPISWKGTVEQYVGRLHRHHQGKTEVRVYDYTDHEVPKLLRMYEKRARAYRKIGYEIRPFGSSL